MMMRMLYRYNNPQFLVIVMIAMMMMVIGLDAFTMPVVVVPSSSYKSAIKIPSIAPLTKLSSTATVVTNNNDGRSDSSLFQFNYNNDTVAVAAAPATIAETTTPISSFSSSAATTSSTKFSETTLRSAIKSLCWRLLAGGVTFTSSLRFSKSLSTALSILGSDFLSKAPAMFIGERVMNQSQAGRKSGSDNASRSLAKALIYCLLAVANTLTMAIFISGDLKLASKIAGSDALIKTLLMFVYERIWAKIEWGKEYYLVLDNKNDNNNDTVTTTTTTTTIDTAM